MRAGAGAGRTLVQVNALLLVLRVDNVTVEAAADVPAISQVSANMIASSTSGFRAGAGVMTSQFV